MWLPPARGQLVAFGGELAGREAVALGFFGEDNVQGFKVVPVAGRRQIDLQHPGVGRKAERAHAGVKVWRVAFDPNGGPAVLRGVLDGSEEVQVIGKHRDERKKDMQAALTGFHAQRRPDQ